MPAPRSPLLPPQVVDFRLITPREAALEDRISAIEARLKREDAERASWERLKMIGLVLAA
ncbi:hypothetical protein ASG43_03420 [Aureimonas sp. Leaf454]|uniref:hypothetical protein n=1 Tax=Aureimonas sp. Leaf454 TaxID=1736381 RepID=UPI0006F8BCEA|nr:hypothetical protein [Aureimonas sp. Leaf454]KQT54650.1 hypothetical protein ASG43_03420 [Aureimonas sp. Leaf454]